MARRIQSLYMIARVELEMGPIQRVVHFQIRDCGLDGGLVSWSDDGAERSFITTPSSVSTSSLGTGA